MTGTVSVPSLHARQSATNGGKTAFVLGDEHMFSKDRFDTTTRIQFTEIPPIKDSSLPAAGIKTGAGYMTVLGRLKDNVRFEDFSTDAAQDRLASVTSKVYNRPQKVQETQSTYKVHRQEAIHISQRARLDRVSLLSLDTSPDATLKGVTHFQSQAQDAFSSKKLKTPLVLPQVAKNSKASIVPIPHDLSHIPCGDKEKQRFKESEVKHSFRQHSPSAYRVPKRHEVEKNADILPPPTSFKAQDIYITTHKTWHKEYKSERMRPVSANNTKKSSVVFGDQVRPRLFHPPGLQQLEYPQFDKQVYVESAKPKPKQPLLSLGADHAFHPEQGPSLMETTHHSEYKTIEKSLAVDAVKDNRHLASHVKTHMISSHLPQGDPRAYACESFVSTTQDCFPPHKDIHRPASTTAARLFNQGGFKIGDEESLNESLDTPEAIQDRFATTASSSFKPLDIRPCGNKRHAYARLQPPTAFSLMADQERYPMKDNKTTEQDHYASPSQKKHSEEWKRAISLPRPLAERKFMFPVQKQPIKYESVNKDVYKLRKGLLDIAPPAELYHGKQNASSVVMGDLHGHA